MCTTCGCGSGVVRIECEGAAGAYRRIDGHRPAAFTLQQPHHGAAHGHAHGPLGAVHAPGMPDARLVAVEEDLLAANDAVAQRIRNDLAARGVFAVNLLSSPGSGKTTLLVRTIERMAGRSRVTVIEGDQQTSRDAERIRATGVPALQVNTGKGCHLDAHMIERALAAMPPPQGSVLFVENVGNLVCPAAFDLGEARKVVILSVTEGDDKPLKYPDMFAAADLLVVSKVDLLPYVAFDVDAAVACARRVHPGLEALLVSATTGAGMDAWLAWLEQGAGAARSAGQTAAAAADEAARVAVE